MFAANLVSKKNEHKRRTTITHAESSKPHLRRKDEPSNFKQIGVLLIERLFGRNTTRAVIKRILMEHCRVARNRLFPPRSILLSVDFPILSLSKPALVPDSIVVYGWALSNPPVRRIKIYLDSKLLALANYGIFRPDVNVVHPQFRGAELSGFNKLVTLEGEWGQHRLTIVAENDRCPPASAEGLIALTRTSYLPSPTLTAEEIRRKPMRARVTVIILTKSPRADLVQTMERLSAQKGILKPEIVVINSGASDLGELNKFDLKIHSISPAEFNHATTRNYAAEIATGEYIVFLADDAIPASTDLLLKMLTLLLKNSKVGAVTARQIPRSDSDLMGCYTIWEYYRNLGLYRDRVTGSVNRIQMTFEQKRGMFQIDDICSCYRRDIFLKYKYSKSITYAEDLELGIRLVKGGFKIAQLYSTGVIHSHNRPPSYYFKRCYVERKALSNMLGDKPHDFGSLSSKSVDDCIEALIHVDLLARSSVEALKDEGFCEFEIPAAFELLSSRIVNGYICPSSAPSELTSFLHQIEGFVEHERISASESIVNALCSRFLGAMNPFREWLTESHANVKDIEEDFVIALYKVLASQMGTFLGEYFLLASSNVHDERILVLDRLLSRDI
ncbi:MAG: glycosyltransferase [Candidatus Bathyarchaeia archaeon]